MTGWTIWYNLTTTFSIICIIFAAGFDGNLLIRAFEKYRRRGVVWPPERIAMDAKAASGARQPPKLSALPWKNLMV